MSASVPPVSDAEARLDDGATAISFRVLDGSANLALIARNAGTSIGSIDLFYAKYLRGTDDMDALTSIKRTNKK